MKKIIMLITATTLIAGCSTTNSVDASQEAYLAGQITAAVYKDTEGAQSSEINQAAKVAYYALVRITEGESENALDTIIEEELGRLDSEVGKVLVLNYYKTAKDNLSARLGTTDLSLPILTEFRKGVDSVIK